MLSLDARRAFFDAKMRGSLDDCIAAADSLAGVTSACEAKVMHLYAAESLALRGGMPGLVASQLWAAVQTDLSDEVLWLAFEDAALQARDVALMCRAFHARISAESDNSLKALYTLLFGHCLHFAAAEHDEAAKAYAQAVSFDPLSRTAALVALHQLRRDDLVGNAAPIEIKQLCDDVQVSEQSYQKILDKLRSIPSDDAEQRALTLLELAKMTLWCLGDTGQAMLWISASLELSDNAKSEAALLINSIGLASPTNPAALYECISWLEKLLEWKKAYELYKALVRLSDSPAEKMKTALGAAHSAYKASLSVDVVTHFIFKAAYAQPALWIKSVDSCDWISAFASESVIFRDRLAELFEQLGAFEESDKLNCPPPDIVDITAESFVLSQPPDSELPIIDALVSDQTESDIIPSATTNDIEPVPGFMQTLSDPSHPSDSLQNQPSWKFVVGSILKYVPCSLAWSSRYPEGWQSLIESWNSPDEAYPVLHDALSEMIQNSGFFLQVVRMNDNQNQQRLKMDQLDEAIALYANDTAKKNGLLAQKYQIAEILGDDRIKLNCLKEILESAPDDPFANSCVMNMDEELLKPHAQIMLCQLQVLIIKDPALLFEKRMHLAQLYVRSSQYNNAINLYHALIDENPDDLTPRYELLNLLIQLENWKSAENVLLSLVNLEEDDARRYDNFIRLAEIQDDKMMMPSRALLTLFAALDLQADILGLHDRLCQISERLHSYSPLIDKYEELTTNGKTEDVRSQATLVLARVYLEHVGKPGVASRILNEYYEKEGGNSLKFTRSMALLCQKMCLWKDYVRVIVRITELTSDKREVIRALLNAAQVYAANLGDYVQAVQLARRAAELDPDNPDDWVEIAQIFALRDEFDLALTALQRALRYQVGADRAQTLLMISQILASSEDLPEATRMFHLAAVIHPGIDILTPVAESLISLATTRHNQDVFVTVCNDLVEASESEDERSQLLLQQALTLARVFDDEVSARSIVDSLKNKVPEFDLDQCCMLADIYSLIHEERASIDLNFSILKNMQPDNVQRFERLQAMLISAVRVQENSLIREVCLAILELDPEDTNANFHLIQMDYIAGKWDVAATRIQRFLPYTERLNAESAMLMQYYYADILHAAEHDDLAIESLNNALGIRSDYRPAVDLKLTILLEHHRWRESLPIFNDLLELTHDDDEKGAIHKRIAEIWHFFLNDGQRAIAEYEIALTLGGDVEDVPIRLLSLYRETGNWQKAAITAQILAQAQVSSNEARLEYLLVLADVWDNHLNESALAANTYMEAFEISPLNQNVVKPLVKVLLKRRDPVRLNEVTQRLLTFASREFSTALALMTRVFKICVHSPVMRPVLDETLQALLKQFPNEPAIQPLKQLLETTPVTSDDASSPNNSPSDSSLPPAPPDGAPRKRKRTITSPRASLKIDSGLLFNLDSGVRKAPADGLDKPKAGDSGFVIGRPKVGDSGLREQPIAKDKPVPYQKYASPDVIQPKPLSKLVPLRAEDENKKITQRELPDLPDLIDIELLPVDDDDDFLPLVEGNDLLTPIDDKKI